MFLDQTSTGCAVAEEQRALRKYSEGQYGALGLLGFVPGTGGQCLGAAECDFGWATCVGRALHELEVGMQAMYL